MNNLFTHEAPKRSRNSFKGVRAFMSNWNLKMLVFVEGGKTGEPGEKPSVQGREPTTNSTRIINAESGNRTRAIFGGRRVLSPLRLSLFSHKDPPRDLIS